MATFNKLHKDSKDSVASELDLFATPLTKTSVLESDILEVKPITAAIDNQIEFEIDASNEHYLDIENTFIHVQGKVLKKDGSNLAAGESPVIPANNMLHTMFSSVSVQINGKVLEEENNYSHRAFLEDLLNVGRSAKKTHHRTNGWYDDSGTGMHHTGDLTAPIKAHLLLKAGFLKESKMFELIGKLRTGITQQERYLPPGCTIRIKLQRSSPEFVLQKLSADDGDEYQIRLTSIQLLCEVKKPNPAVQIAQMKLLAQGNKAKFPYTRVQTRFFTLAPGIQDKELTILQNGQEPKRVFLAMIDHVAKNGSYGHNPFKFAHNGVQTVRFNVGGHYKPATPSHMDFETGLHMRPFHTLQLTCGKADMNDDNGITPEDFVNGKTIFCLDNTPDRCNGKEVHLFRRLTTSVYLAFKRALTTTVSVFVYLEFDEIAEIDNSRVLTFATGS